MRDVGNSDVKHFNLSDDSALRVHAALLTLEGGPAWAVIVQFLQEEEQKALEAMAASFDQPSIVAFMAGVHHAMRFTRTLPQVVANRALQIMQEREAVDESVMERQAIARGRRPFANTAGEVS